MIGFKEKKVGTNLMKKYDTAQCAVCKVYFSAQLNKHLSSIVSTKVPILGSLKGDLFAVFVLWTSE